MAKSDSKKPIAQDSPSPASGGKKDTAMEKKVPLKSTPIPPGHVIATLTAMIAISVATLPSMENIEEAATIELLTKRIFPEIISLTLLAYIRLAFALVIWSVVLYGVFLEPSSTCEVPYITGSKLIQTPFEISGIKTTYFFTSFSWCLLGVAFTLLSIITFQVEAGGEEPSPMMRSAAFIFWEVSSPMTLLVSGIVKYVLWPAALKKGSSANGFKLLRTLMQHNANTLFAVVESALLSGMPVRLSDFALSPLLGCLYVVFLWNITRAWAGPDGGPQVPYFFLDPTAPGYFTSYALVGLLSALLTSFIIYAVASDILALLGGSLLAHSIYTIVLVGSVMKFAD